MGIKPQKFDRVGVKQVKRDGIKDGKLKRLNTALLRRIHPLSI
jgi:hypothetical protein